jgi:hypothetical protein
MKRILLPAELKKNPMQQKRELVRPKKSKTKKKRMKMKM